MEEYVNGLTFAEWMKRVNAKIISLTGGFNANDLPDWHYWDSWADGMNPVETAKDAIRNAKEY